MKKRFLRNRRNRCKQGLPPPKSPKSPVDGRFKSNGFGINEPPNVKRRPNFSVLSSAAAAPEDTDEEIKQKHLTHESKDGSHSQSHKSGQCEEFTTTSAQLHLNHYSKNIDDDDVLNSGNQVMPPTPSSLHEGDEGSSHHTLNLSITISGKSQANLDNILKKLMRDLDMYQQQDSSILSTNCVLSSDLNRSASNDIMKNNEKAKDDSNVCEVESGGLKN